MSLPAIASLLQEEVKKQAKGSSGRPTFADLVREELYREVIKKFGLSR